MLLIVLRHCAVAIATLLASGLFGAALIRFGPGYEMDERVVDPRYSDSTAQAITAEHARDPDLLTFYAHFIVRALHGDFGVSRSLDTPVSELLRSRGPVTLRLIAAGLLTGWVAALALAAAATYFAWGPLTLFAEILSGAAASFPVAVVALVVFLARGPVFLVLALAIFPRVFRYGRDLFEAGRREGRVEAARTRGIPEPVIFARYFMRPALPPLLALAGVSFSIAVGALIPVEVVCDIPGIGQLAWKAALGRDLPVLVTLTLIITAITIAVNGIAEVCRAPRFGAAGGPA